MLDSLHLGRRDMDDGGRSRRYFRNGDAIGRSSHVETIAGRWRRHLIAHAGSHPCSSDARIVCIGRFTEPMRSIAVSAQAIGAMTVSARNSEGATAAISWKGWVDRPLHRDAMSGSTTGRVAIANTTTADYQDYGERQPGTNWGMSDPYNVRCFGACLTEAGSGG